MHQKLKYISLLAVSISFILPEVSSAKFEKLVEKLRSRGVGEVANLIVAIDYTQSNEKRGKRTYHGFDLHDIRREDNPYQTTLHAIGQTLFQLDGNCKVPLLGFGDERTLGKSFFTLHEGCRHPDQALAVYNELTPRIVKAGPTNFAPVIRKTIELARESGSLQILVIVTDGEVEGQYPDEHGRFVSCEEETQAAIVAASNYPISIIGVGVGDGDENGRFGDLKAYDDMKGRRFDNFNFVKFSDFQKSPFIGEPYYDAEGFAEKALDELPEQLKKMKKLGILK